MTEDLAKGFDRIIKNYTIDNNLIHIYYINGDTEVKEYLEYNKEKIEHEMLKQAKEIVESRTSENFLTNRRVGLVETSFTSGIMAMMGAISVEVAFGSIDEKRVIAELITSLIVSAIVYLTIKSNQNKDDMEVKKYKLFIENHDEFEKNKLSGQLYDGINIKGYVGINNLDSYSFEEIERMHKNIQNVRKRTNN